MTIPQLLRTMNGKHVALFHPIRRGSTCYNYEGFNSILLLALANADYKFVYVDIGCQGRLTDGAVLKNASFYKAINTNSLNPKPLPDIPNANGSFHIDSHRQTSVLYVFVADDVFPISTIFMKPYAHKNLLESYILYNYRLSRARRTTENAFEILSNRFRAFCSKIYLKPETVTKILMASCLHNLLRTNFLRTVLSLKDSGVMKILCLVFKLSAN